MSSDKSQQIPDRIFRASERSVGVWQQGLWVSAYNVPVFTEEAWSRWYDLSPGGFDIVPGMRARIVRVKTLSQMQVCRSHRVVKSIRDTKVGFIIVRPSL